MSVIGEGDMNVTHTCNLGSSIPKKKSGSDKKILEAIGTHTSRILMN